MSKTTAARLVTGLLLLQLSCGDLPTALPSRPLHRTVPSARVLLVPETGAAEFVVGSEAPLKGDVQSLGYYPWPAVVLMKVHQYFSITTVPPYPPGTGEIGLSGRGWGWGCSHQGEAYVVTYFDGGGYGFPFEGCQLPDPGPDGPISTFSDTILVMGQVNYGYTLDSACPYPDTACAAYSGSSGVELRRIPLTDFDIQGDSVRDGVLEAWPNLDYEIAATPSPFTMGRQWTPMSVMPTGWKFQPDTGALEEGACSNGSGRVCVKNFRHGGTMTVEAIVNGDRITSKPLRVRVPTISLQVSRADAVVGDTIEVTTTITGTNIVALTKSLGYSLLYYPAASASTSNAAPVAAITSAASGVRSLIPSAGLVPAAPTQVAVPLAALDSAPSDSSAPAPAPALKPCLGVYPGPTHCYVVVTTAGRAQMYGSMTITNRLHPHSEQWITVREAPACGGSSQASATKASATGSALAPTAGISASCAEESPTISITRAAGPNGPAGSFTTTDTESTISLVAAVTPASAAASVKWTVTPNLAGTYRPHPITASIPDGATSSFRVPASIRADTARWPRDHASALGEAGLARKVMAYTIVASVTVNGQTVTSAPVTVKQDADDVLRQEYIDWKKKHTPSRADLATAGDPQRNSGDYTHFPTNDLLPIYLPLLQRAAVDSFGRSLTSTGGYRNPAHHHYHIHATRLALNSQHLYGGAVDFNISNTPEIVTATPPTPPNVPPGPPKPPKRMTVLQYFNAIGALANKDSISGCFEPEWAIRAGSGGNLDHAHVHWSHDPCGWK